VSGTVLFSDPVQQSKEWGVERSYDRSQVHPGLEALSLDSHFLQGRDKINKNAIYCCCKE
jgi:hypothetical protein